MSIYTKTGDGGETGLYTGERVKKSSPRVAAYGALDEGGSALGLARALCRNSEVKARIKETQAVLPSLMAALASSGDKAFFPPEQVGELEKKLDELEAALPPVKCFLTPGDTPGGAALDLARTTLRRAERELYRLAEEERVPEAARLYLNRLSDYVFLLMRLEEEGRLTTV